MSGWRKKQIERLKMTKEEIIKMAKKADLTQHENPHFGTYTATTVSLMRFAKLVAEKEPVAWVGLNLDGMVEAFHRVIEEHHSRKNPFHDPVNGDAMLALRELRGLIAYMKRNTTPPQRTWAGLTDEEKHEIRYSHMTSAEFIEFIEAKLKSKNFADVKE